MVSVRDYRATISAPGFTPRDVEIEADTRAAVQIRNKLDPAPVVDEPPPPPPPPREDNIVVTPPPPPAPAPPPTRARSKVPAIVATATTGAAAITAALLYAKARTYINDAEAAATKPKFDELVDTAHRFQHASWVAAGVAGAGALVSGWLWYRSSRPVRVEMTTTSGGAAVSVGGVF